MNKTQHYAPHTWRVFLNARFAGYVVCASEWGAIKKAQEKFGKNIWIERIVV